MSALGAVHVPSVDDPKAPMFVEGPSEAAKTGDEGNTDGKNKALPGKIKSSSSTTGGTIAELDHSQCFIPVPTGSWLWLYSPHSTFFMCWDLGMAFSLFIIAIVTPFEVAFISGGPLWLMLFNKGLDTLFFLDMFFNFFLPYQGLTNMTVFDKDEQDPTGKWIKDHHLIVKNYVLTWFSIDLVSIFPFDLIQFAVKIPSGGSMKIIRLLKLTRLAKLLRILRAGRLFQRWESAVAINYSVIALYQFLFCFIFLAHWMACLWRLMARDSGDDSDSTFVPTECDENPSACILDNLSTLISTTDETDVKSWLDEYASLLDTSNTMSVYVASLY
eukprot:gene2589-3342_t